MERDKVEISSILSSSDSGDFLFYFFLLNGQVENENKRLLQNILNGNVLYLNALLSPCSSQFFSFLVSKCWLQKSSHQFSSGGINIAAHWLTYILLCLVTLVSFLNSLGLSKKASLVFLLAKRHLSSVFSFGKFWLLATDGVCLREAQQDLRGVLCGLSLVAPFVAVVWEERAPKWVVLAFPSYSASSWC